MTGPKAKLDLTADRTSRFSSRWRKLNIETNSRPFPALSAFPFGVRGMNLAVLRYAVQCLRSRFSSLRLLDCEMKLADPDMQPQAFFREFLGTASSPTRQGIWVNSGVPGGLPP
jgi:hypothetical protein